MGAWIGDVVPETAAEQHPRGDRTRMSTTDLPRRVRRRLRHRGRRPLVGARPRQPDRRAHRLQRRLRAAVRDRPAHTVAVGRRDDGMLRVAEHVRRPGVVTRSSLAELDPAAMDGWSAYLFGIAWALSRRSCPTVADARRLAADLSRVRARHLRRVRRAGRRRPLVVGGDRVRGRASPSNDLWGLELDRGRPRRGRAARRERRRRRADRHHGPVGVAARPPTPRCSSTAARSRPRSSPSASPRPGSSCSSSTPASSTRTPPAATASAAHRARRAPPLLGVALAARPDVDDLDRRRRLLDDETFRRVRHVVTENQRVLDTVRTLRERRSRRDRRAARRVARVDARRLRDLGARARPRRRDRAGERRPRRPHDRRRIRRSGDRARSDGLAATSRGGGPSPASRAAGYGEPRSSRSAADGARRATACTAAQFASGSAPQSRLGLGSARSLEPPRHRRRVSSSRTAPFWSRRRGADAAQRPPRAQLQVALGGLDHVLQQQRAGHRPDAPGFGESQPATSATAGSTSPCSAPCPTRRSARG